MVQQWEGSKMGNLISAIRRAGGLINREDALQTNESGDLFVAQGATAEFTEIVRQGQVWSVMSGAGTPLVVIPTTLCILEIFNNHASKAMEVLDLSLFHLLGTAALHNISLWAEVTAEKAAPTLAALVVGSHSGKAPYTTTAATPVVTAAGTTVVTAGWKPWGMPGPGVVSTALPGEAWSVPVNGKLIVPPRCSLAITAVDALATGSSVQVGASWAFRDLSVATS